MRRWPRALGGWCLLLAWATASCDTSDVTAPRRFEPVAEVGSAMALGLWTPSGTDTCTPAIHDSYSVVGPDGLRYPTWHPPVDPATGCTFGHEHGRDPSSSALYAEVGPIPFGYANQHLQESGFGAMRHEDHVGHKVEWENGMTMRAGNSGTATLLIKCDVLTKLHQGTHSPDAFTNNLHEVVYHVRCTDGTAFSATLLTPIGTPGELVASCDRDRHVTVGIATPPNSPEGGGKRALPDIGCVQANVLNPPDGRPRFDALRESWEVSASLRAANGRTLASFNPYYQVIDPSRYYDPALDRAMGRPIELCYQPAVQGRDRCEGLPPTAIAWDDPRSPFKGVRRFVDVNGNNVRNADGPNVWYTDPLGRRGSPEPFPGALRQWIARHDNSGLELHGGVMGRDRDYNAPGVRAPN
ncbi:MAG: hypothetical protein OEW77_03940 [Gemmatimonadota bacterium]|nr:hypothetical protein [Gemmatimonadota bacterium]